MFSGSNAMRTIMRHLQEAPRPPSEASPYPVPESLDQVVLACLAKPPAKRPESATELRRRLAAIDLPDTWGEQDAFAWWQKHLPVALS